MVIVKDTVIENISGNINLSNMGPYKAWEKPVDGA